METEILMNISPDKPIGKETFDRLILFGKVGFYKVFFFSIRIIFLSQISPGLSPNAGAKAIKCIVGNVAVSKTFANKCLI